MRHLSLVTHKENYASLDISQLRQFLAVVKPVQDLRLDQLTIGRIGHRTHIVYRSRYLVASLPVDGPWHGAVTFPLREFLSSVGKARKGILAVTDFGGTLGIMVNGGRINIPVVNRDDIPALPEGGFGPEMDIEAFWSAPYLGKVVQRDSVRNYGSVVQFENGFTRVVATDGFRLALVDSGQEGTEKNSLCLGRQSFISLSELLKEGEALLSVSEDTTTVKVQGTAITAFYRTSSVKYPNYRSILPEGRNYRGVAFNRKILLEKLKESLAFTDKSRVIQLEVFREGLKISVAEKYEGWLPMDAEPISAVTLNCQFLIDALAGSKKETGKLLIKNNEDPVCLILGNTETNIVPIRKNE